MKYDDLSNFKKYELPEGFHYEFFKPGDEEEWVRIHIESGEFTSIEKGLKHFHDFYDSFKTGNNYVIHDLLFSGRMILQKNGQNVLKFSKSTIQMQKFVEKKVTLILIK